MTSATGRKMERNKKKMGLISAMNLQMLRLPGVTSNLMTQKKEEKRRANTTRRKKKWVRIQKNLGWMTGLSLYSRSSRMSALRILRQSRPWGMVRMERSILSSAISMGSIMLSR